MQALRLILDLAQMFAVPETFGVDLVNVFRAGRTRREPAGFGDDFDATNGFVIARSPREHGLDGLAREFLDIELNGVKSLHGLLLLWRRRRIDALIEGVSQFLSQLAVKFARIAPHAGGDFGGKQSGDDSVLVGRPHRAIAAQERRARALFAAES